MSSDATNGAYFTARILSAELQWIWIQSKLCTTTVVVEIASTVASTAETDAAPGIASAVCRSLIIRKPGHSIRQRRNIRLG